MWEMVGVGVAVVCVAMLGIVSLAKAITIAVRTSKAKKRRRSVEPSKPRKHVMTKAERDVHRALIAANERRGIKQ